MNTASIFTKTEVTEIRSILADLIKSHAALFDIEAKRVNEHRLRIAVGLSNQVCRSARSADELFERRLLGDCVTAARRSFEFALTAAWVTHEAKSAEAFHRKSLYAARALMQSVTGAGITMSDDTLKLVAADLPARDELDHELKQFEKLCNRFNPKLYVAYRLLCSHAHPSFSTVAIMFMDSEDERNQAIKAEEQSAVIAIHTAAASLVWAGRALDSLHVGQPNKPTLQTAARKLAISPVLYTGMPDEGRWPI